MKTMMAEWAVTLALSSLTVAAACAAEMPVKARPPAAPPVPTWTGLYIGVNGGGVWGTTYPNFTIDDSQGNYFTFGAGQTANVVAVQGAGNSSFNNSGYIVGGHIGYNNQIDYAVFGVEADFDAFRPKGSSSFVGALPATATGLCTGGACTAFTFNNSSSANWLATLRGRFGVAVYNGLLYGTAGLAVTHMSFSSAFFNATTSPPQVSGGLTENFSDSRVLFGAALGGGAEWAFVPGWSLGVEYLFVGFNGFRPDAQTTIAVPTNGALGGTCPPSSGGHFCSVFHYGYAMNESIVRARLTYRIGNIWH